MTALRLLPLARASIKRYKTRSVVFTLFTMFCAACVLLTVSIIMPLWNNMENKVNSHPYNLELTAEMSETGESLDNKLSEIKALEHVVKVYKSCFDVQLFGTSNELNDMFTLSYFHNDYIPVITSGRTVNEDELGMAVIADSIPSTDPLTQRRTEIDGKSLIGKTLDFQDESGNNWSFKIIGTFDVTDPALDEMKIYTSFRQLEQISAAVNDSSSSTPYSIIVDNYRNRDAVEAECSEIVDLVYYGNSFNIDLSNYNTALVALLIVLALFIVMVIIGTSVFVSNCIGNRINELALYRSLGFKAGHIFTIIFAEYFMLLLVGIVLSVAASFAVGELIINPYLGKTFGEGLMAMQVEFSIFYILIVFLIMTVITAAVCLRATLKTGKIQLTVLLKER